MGKQNTGNGATVTLANQTLIVIPRKITLGSRKIGTIDVTDLSRTKGAAQLLIPGDISEYDSITIEGSFDTEEDFPKLGDVSDTVSAIAGDGDLITITLPLHPTQATAAKITGSGFFTELPLPDLENEAEMVGVMTWQFNGVTGPTYTKAVPSA